MLNIHGRGERQCGPSKLNTYTAYCSQTKKNEKMNKQECGLELKGAREERDCGV